MTGSPIARPASFRRESEQPPTAPFPQEAPWHHQFPWLQIVHCLKRLQDLSAGPL